MLLWNSKLKIKILRFQINRRKASEPKINWLQVKKQRKHYKFKNQTKDQEDMEERLCSPVISDLSFHYLKGENMAWM
jgi:hypothetical protein